MWHHHDKACMSTLPVYTTSYTNHHDHSLYVHTVCLRYLLHRWPMWHHHDHTACMSTLPVFSYTEDLSQFTQLMFCVPAFFYHNNSIQHMSLLISHQLNYTSTLTKATSWVMQKRIFIMQPKWQCMYWHHKYCWLTDASTISYKDCFYFKHKFPPVFCNLFIDLINKR